MTITRRSVITGAAVLPAIGGQCLASTSIDPICEMAAKFREMTRHINNDLGPDTEDKDLNALVSEAHELSQEIGRTRAVSIEGVAAQIEHARYSSTEFYSDEVVDMDLLANAAASLRRIAR